MSNYVVSDASLGAVADAIRAKGGTTAALEYPEGFVQAIGEISGGGNTEYSYGYTNRSLASIHRAMNYDSSRKRIWLGASEDQKNRRSIVLCQPVVNYNLPLKNYTGWTDSIYYPIPIPSDANRITVNCEPLDALAINYYAIAKVSGSEMALVKSGNGAFPAVIDFIADENLVFALNIRPNPDASTFDNEIMDVRIKFETV